MICYPIAKINLGLNVVSRRPDGYHNLETVFYPVGLKDVLVVNEVCKVSALSADCELEVSNLVVEGDPRCNLVVRAYDLLKGLYPSLPSVHAHLVKNIPTQAGMGGGSSDCAYMLQLLNEQFCLGLSRERLIALSATLGADCPFFVIHTPCYAEGIGERLEPIDLDLGGWHLAIVKPPVSVSTREAFSLITPKLPAKNCRMIVSQPVETWRSELVNDFEASVFALYPKVGEVKDRLYELGAVYSAMSGSGSAVFGLFREKPCIEELFPDCFTTVVTL